MSRRPQAYLLDHSKAAEEETFKMERQPARALVSYELVTGRSDKSSAAHDIRHRMLAFALFAGFSSHLHRTEVARQICQHCRVKSQLQAKHFPSQQLVLLLIDLIWIRGDSFEIFGHRDVKRLDLVNNALLLRAIFD
jgi:hypothetical protein